MKLSILSRKLIFAFAQFTVNHQAVLLYKNIIIMKNTSIPHNPFHVNPYKMFTEWNEIIFTHYKH